MRTIDVTATLLLEVHPQRPSIHLVSLDAQFDGEIVPGVVIVRPAEIKPLVAALAQAAGEMAEEAVR